MRLHLERSWEYANTASAHGPNGIEIDTAIRHKFPVTIIVSNNGGWTTQREGARSVGQEMGTPDYEKIAQAFGSYGERVERPEHIPPALGRAKNSGTSAITDAIADPKTAATTVKFAAPEYAQLCVYATIHQRWLCGRRVPPTEELAKDTASPS